MANRISSYDSATDQLELAREQLDFCDALVAFSKNHHFPKWEIKAISRIREEALQALKGLGTSLPAE